VASVLRHAKKKIVENQMPAIEWHSQGMTAKKFFTPLLNSKFQAPKSISLRPGALAEAL
jgi:hypothetical protein